MGSSRNAILHPATAGATVLDGDGNLRDNMATFQFFLAQEQGDTAKPGPGRIPVCNVRGSGAAIDVTEGCYSIITAYQSSAAIASGALGLNTTGVFRTSWRVNAPMGNPNCAAVVEPLRAALGSAAFGSVNDNPLGSTFFGFTDRWQVSRGSL